MFNQLSALFQTPLKEPIDKLVELNISTASTVAHQQGLLIASLIDGSLSFSRNISTSTDITKLVAEQSKFSADVQSQLTEAIKETSGTIIKAKKDAEVIFNESFSELSAKVADEPKPTAAAKPAPEAAAKPAPKAAAKPAPKAAAKPAPKAAVKAAPKAAVKAAPKAAVKPAPKVEVKAAPKAEVKAAPKAEVKAAPKAEVKAAPKAEVKAAPKAEVKAAPKA